jgi:hypothetical protein
MDFNTLTMTDLSRSLIPSGASKRGRERERKREGMRLKQMNINNKFMQA